MTFQPIETGRKHPEKDESFITVVNPANGEVIASVPNYGKEEAVSAVDKAYLAFQSWSKKQQQNEAVTCFNGKN